MRKVLGAIIILIACVVLAGSVAAAVGLWYVKAPTLERVLWILGRVDTALATAEDGLAEVRASLGRAETQLASVREERRQPPARPNLSVGRMIGRGLQQRVVPDVGNAQEKLQLVAQAAVLVTAMLDDVNEFTFIPPAKREGDRLEQMNRQLASVGSAAWDWSRKLGDSDEASDEAMQRVDQTVTALRALALEYENRIRDTRDQTNSWKARTLPWITPVAVVITLVLLWVALSQLSMISRGWALLRTVNS